MNFYLCPAQCMAHGKYSANTVCMFSSFIKENMAIHLYVVLVTILSSNTTPGFVGLYVIIGRLSQKINFFKKMPRFPQELLEGKSRMQHSPSSNSN